LVLTEDLVNETVKAHEGGVEVEDYLVARDRGLSHNELMEAVRAKVYVPHYSQARVELGVSREELFEAVGAGCRVPDYMAAIESGGAHAEVLEAQTAGVHLVGYACGRETLTHRQILAVAEAGVSVHDFARCVEMGASQKVVEEALAGGIALYDLAYGLERGASGAELGEAIATLEGKLYLYYIDLRSEGKSHGEAMTLAIQAKSPGQGMGTSCSKLTEGPRVVSAAVQAALNDPANQAPYRAAGER
jgi:hypothetical protein